MSAADETHVSFESGERLTYDQFVWTGGIRGSDAVAGNRPSVKSDLRLDEHAFALDDSIVLTRGFLYFVGFHQ